MLDNSLLDVLQSSWRKWDIPSMTVKPVKHEDDKYIVFTNLANDLNNGIYFYLIMNDDGTYTLKDGVLTVDSVNRRIGDFNQIKHNAAQIASQYGILLDNQGEFINSGVGQLDLSAAMLNFEKMMFDVVDYAMKNIR